jgi:hypothetical protein
VVFVGGDVCPYEVARRAAISAERLARAFASLLVILVGMMWIIVCWYCIESQILSKTGLCPLFCAELDYSLQDLNSATARR